MRPPTFTSPAQLCKRCKFLYVPALENTHTDLAEGCSLPDAIAGV
jgi:hypothetical protein